MTWEFLLLRLTLSILMLFHGVSKLAHGSDFIGQIVTSAGLPYFITYGVYIGEVIAPLLILAGYATRVAALVYAFNMLVATLMVHSSQVFSINPTTGGWTVELQGLYFFAALVLVFTGGGKYALSKKNLWD
ncbi:MAG: DoxX family protein [Paludibacteraceae bacterium]